MGGEAAEGNLNAVKNWVAEVFGRVYLEQQRMIENAVANVYSSQGSAMDIFLKEQSVEGRTRSLLRKAAENKKLVNNSKYKHISDDAERIAKAIRSGDLTREDIERAFQNESQDWSPRI